MILNTTWNYNHIILFSPQLIEEFRSKAREIMLQDSIIHFEMVRLDCEDLKRGLAEKSRSFGDLLLDRMASDHWKENEKYAVALYNILTRIPVLFVMLSHQCKICISILQNR